MKYYSRKKNRLREIDFEKIEAIKDKMKFTWSEVSALLGFNESSTQVFNYRKCGKVPADRYYAARDALLLACEDELRARRELIMQLFN